MYFGFYKNKKAFTLLEILFVMFIGIIIFYFLSKLFVQANLIMNVSKQRVKLYEKQTNFYMALKQDITSSLIIQDNTNNTEFISEIEEINANLNDLFSSFEGTNTGFAFVTKRKDQNLSQDIDANDTGIYKVEYRFTIDSLDSGNNNVERQIYSPNTILADFSLTDPDLIESNNWIIRGEDTLVFISNENLNNQGANIEFVGFGIAYLIGNVWQTNTNVVPDKIRISIDAEYREARWDNDNSETLRFEHIFDVRGV
jgi:competence protein ComGC